VEVERRQVVAEQVVQLARDPDAFREPAALGQQIPRRAQLPILNSLGQGVNKSPPLPGAGREMGEGGGGQRPGDPRGEGLSGAGRRLASGYGENISCKVDSTAAIVSSSMAPSFLTSRAESTVRI
jgi:hypothetical protein